MPPIPTPTPLVVGRKMTTQPAFGPSERDERTRRRMKWGAAVALLYAIFTVAVASHGTSIGFTTLFGGPVLAVEVDSEAARAGIRRGDVLVEVNGVPTPGAIERAAELRKLEPGARLSLVVERDGSRRVLSWTTNQAFPLGSAAAAALAALLLSLALLADRGGKAGNPRDFYRSTIVYVVFLAGLFSWDTIGQTLAMAIPWCISMCLAAPVTCHFMLKFPAGPTDTPRSWWLPLYLPPALLSALFVYMAVGFRLGWLAESGSAIGLIGACGIMVMSAIYLTVGVVTRAKRIRRRGALDPVATRWLRLGGWVIALPMIAGAAWAVYDREWFVGGGFAPFVASAMVGGSICVVLAMTRTRFGELDRVLRSGAGHMVTLVVVAGCYLALIAVVGGQSFMGGQALPVAMVATGVAAVIFGPVRSWVQSVVAERFTRDRTRARRALLEAAQFAARTLDIETLQEGVVERVREAVHAEGVMLCELVDAKWSTLAVDGSIPAVGSLAPGDPVASRMELSLATGVREVARGVIAAPFAVGDHGACLLVATHPEQPLGEEECEVVATLAASLSVAMANARAHSEVRRVSHQLRNELDMAERRRKEISRLKERLEEEKHMLEAELHRRGGRPPVIGEGLRDTFDLVHRVARSDASVLVSGETGVGKELIARAIHAGSPRKDAPFVVVDCGAIPANLFESALFGHAKGAFTGATHETLGAFRSGDGGTVFLDEIGELPLELQPKLLRVLQEREVRPVGSEKVIPINVRVVAGTNRDLELESKAGAWREDLLYRLRVIEIKVPALRHRKRDIPELAETFLAAAFERRGMQPKRLSTDALGALLEHDWPGNVRELEHTLEAAAVTCDDEEIRPVHLRIEGDLFRRRAEAELASVDGENGGLRETLESLERDRLIEALREHGGNRTAAAKALGMSRGALLRRIQRYKVAL